MYYSEILREFDTNSIRYLIVGGLSVNLHGIPRVTQDIDFILSMDNDNLGKVLNILNNLGYTPQLPVFPEDLLSSEKREFWIKEKNLKAFSFCNKHKSYMVVDILLVHPLDFEEAYKKRIVKNLKEYKIYLVSIEDLIKMKKYSGRSQDLSDIELLRKLQKFLGEDHEN